MKTPKPKKGAWFVKVRWSYLPCSWQGWLTYIPFVAFLIGTLQLATRTESSIRGVLYIVFPEWVAAAVVMHWVASNKS